MWQSVGVMKTPILILLASIATAFAQDEDLIAKTPPSLRGKPSNPNQPVPTTADPFAPETDLRNRLRAEPPSPLDRLCTIDLRNPAQMKDVISNVLTRIEKRPESEVRAFLETASEAGKSADALMLAAAAHFKIDRTKMAVEVQKMRHVNCIPSC